MKREDTVDHFPKKPWLFRVCSTRGKKEISPFPTVFTTHLEDLLPFSLNLKLSSANSVSFGKSKMCRLGKG